MLFVLSPCAAAAGAEALFAEGVAAARSGDYAAAVGHFESARAAGLDTGALHFNLGVAYYRLGRTADARAAFARAAESESMAAPARYQLGRLARERGDADAARRHFRGAAAAARTAAMREHALAALGEVRGPAPPDFVYLALGAGHDSNAGLAPDDVQGLEEESEVFLEALLLVREPLHGPGYLRAAAYLQRFPDADELDFASLRAGLGRVGRLADWRWDLFGDLRQREFGGDDFDAALVAGADLERAIAAAWDLEVDYRLEYIRGADGFGYLDGFEHRIEVTADQRGRAGWRLSAGIERSERDDLERGGDFQSFSWTELYLSLRHGWRLDSRHRLDLRADLARRDYAGSEVRAGTRLGEREDERLALEAAAERALGGGWSGELSLRLERRDADPAEFDYERELLRASVRRVF